MKKLFNQPCRLLALMSLALFVVFWCVWFFGCRYYLVWLEGYSYFSTLPDYTALFKSIPYGLSCYVGAFLHQFYIYPAAGAAIQAIFSILPFICAGIIIIRLFKEPGRLFWIALIPMIFMTSRQFWDLNLVTSLRFAFWSLVPMLAVVAVTMIKRPQWSLPGFLGNRILALVIGVAVAALSVYNIVGLDPAARQHEERARLEYLGDRHRWDDILDIVTPQEARRDEFKRRYALLALTEKGLIADYGFMYGLSSSEDFYFRDTIEPMSLNFNALFYQCLGMPNASIHQAYQLGVQSVSGIGFASLRRLADLYLRLEDHVMASKYIDILSHSTCHRKWVKSRTAVLKTIEGKEPAYTDAQYEATIANFTHTISSMVDRYRDNHKYADLLLCAYLADEEGDKFQNIMRYVAQVQYPDGKNLPRLYEEALILITMVDPYALNGYVISEDTQARFADYVNMMNAGRGTQALRKHADTYWAYSY